ncbi:MAG: hypothetical protein AABN95_25510, partial [Acidobacteriota bacterium]
EPRCTSNSNPLHVLNQEPPRYCEVVLGFMTPAQEFSHNLGSGWVQSLRTRTGPGSERSTNPHETTPTKIVLVPVRVVSWIVRFIGNTV